MAKSQHETFALRAENNNIYFTNAPGFVPNSNYYNGGKIPYKNLIKEIGTVKQRRRRLKKKDPWIC